MAILRKPYQGLLNIIRFNWHFFVVAGLAFLILFISANYLSSFWNEFALILSLLILTGIIFPLLASFYIYDRSGFYKMDWLQNIHVDESGRVINIHAGFDETSELLQAKFATSKFQILDFYNPSRHTEFSIKRARKSRAQIKQTISINSDSIPVPNHSSDVVFLIMAAHEIRDKVERQAFFREIKRILRESGQVVVVEHLRDVPNFLAFNIGFFHFFSRSSWLHTFRQADLKVYREIKYTPFLTIYFLKNGNPS